MRSSKVVKARTKLDIKSGSSVLQRFRKSEFPWHTCLYESIHNLFNRVFFYILGMRENNEFAQQAQRKNL